MNTIKKITVSVVSTVALMFAASCSQNDAVTSKPDSFAVPLEKTSVAWKNLQTFSFSQEHRTLNKDLENLAKSVARTLRNSSVQQELHKKVMAKFDGDTEILWTALNADQTMTNTLRSAGVSDNGQWTNAVAQNGNAFGINSGEEITTLLQKSKQQYFANVHLYWHRAESWDKTSTPLVTYIPTGIDLEKEKILTLTAYDADGNMYEIDAEAAKKYPVIVIGPNERTNMDGTLLNGLSPLASTAPKGSAKTTSFTTLELQWLSFNSTSFDEPFEGWFWGNPEFFAVLHAVTPGATLGLEVGKWSFNNGVIEYWQCDGRVLGGWVGPNRKFFDWGMDYYKTINIRWFEYDPAGETTLTLGLAYKVSVKDATGTVTGETTANLSTQTKVTHATDQLDIMTIHYDTPTRYFGAARPFAMVSF